MRISILAIVLSVACALGCDRKPAASPPPVVPVERPGIDVNAPGVNVRVEPGQGVEVKAPGVDVETKRN